MYSSCKKKFGIKWVKLLQQFNKQSFNYNNKMLQNNAIYE